MPGLGGPSQQSEMSDSRGADDPRPDLAPRCEQLEREIERLRSLLDQHSIAILPSLPAPSPLQARSKRSTAPNIASQDSSEGRPILFSVPWTQGCGREAFGKPRRSRWVQAKHGARLEGLLCRQA